MEGPEFYMGLDNLDISIWGFNILKGTGIENALIKVLLRIVPTLIKEEARGILAKEILEYKVE